MENKKFWLKIKNKKVLIIGISLIVLIVLASLVMNQRKRILINNRYIETMSIIETPVDEPMNTIIEVAEDAEQEIIEENQDNSWDNTADAVDTKVTKSEVKTNNSATYYIKVNYTANTVTIYTKDSSGEYTVPYKAMICSTGTATPTSGTYKISYKYRWLSLFGGVNGQYCTRITGHILFHSVPYLTQSPDTLEYWEYDKLGTSASMGCIRLKVADALWIYNNCTSGTYVEFYSSPDPGPLGKPSAKIISGNERCRDWDPTDPNEDNPWNKPIENNNNNSTENNSNKEEINTNNEAIENTNNENKNTENIENENINTENNNTNTETNKSGNTNESDDTNSVNNSI